MLSGGPASWPPPFSALPASRCCFPLPQSVRAQAAAVLDHTKLSAEQLAFLERKRQSPSAAAAPAVSSGPCLACVCFHAAVCLGII